MLRRDQLEFEHMLKGQTARLAAQRTLNIGIQRLAIVYTSLDAAYDSNDMKACIDAVVGFHQPRSHHHAIRQHKPEAAALAVRQHIEFVRQSMDDNAREKERRSSVLRVLGEPVQ